MQNTLNNSYLDIFLQFLKFGALAWGGPVAQIGMLKEQLVDNEKIITPERFKRVLAVYQVLPGPEAHELCVYFGVLKGNRMGGLLAGLGFMLPGFILMLIFSWLYVTYGNATIVLAAAYGIQPAVVALIVRAIHRIGTHVITERYHWIILGFALLSTLMNIHFFITLTLSGILAIVFSKWQRFGLWFIGIVITALMIYISVVTFVKPVQFTLPVSDGASKANVTTTTTTTNTSTLSYFTTGLKSGLLTFGGAYTILPFLERDAVQQNQWLSEDELVDGIAIASMLPAPLVIIATFVGYVGNGIIGALLMTLGVFLPAFMFTLMGHSWLERLTQQTALHQFLDGVAVGVIGLIVVTAFTLGAHAMQSWIQIIIFSIVLFVTYKSKAAYTVPLLIVATGIVGIILFNIGIYM